MTQNDTTPSAYNHLKVCICNEASTGHTKDCPKRAASAPLTHEEVEQLLAAIKERTALAREMEDSGYDEIELKTWMVIWADMYIRHLQAQLKTRTEDAERMAGALQKIQAIHLEASTRPGGYVSVSSQRMCDETFQTLAALHHFYPPKP